MSNVSTLLVILGITLGCWTSGFSAWLEMTTPDPTPAHIEVQHADPEGTTFTVELTGIEQETVAANGTEYTRFRLPEATFSTIEGAPEVPLISVWIAIPPTSDARVHVRSEGEIVLPDVQVLPHSPTPGIYPENEQYYQQNTFFPAETVQVGDPQILRDVRFVPVLIYPVQVNPVTRDVKIQTALEIEIVTTG
ncbi:MAG: hypothetical protein D6675_10020, partial [Gemmatimonadetes bacterium]